VVPRLVPPVLRIFLDQQLPGVLPQVLFGGEVFEAGPAAGAGVEVFGGAAVVIAPFGGPEPSPQ
jgi:hypothetical protein